MTKLLVALLAIGLDFYIYYYLATDEVVAPRSSFAVFPLEIGEWRCDRPEQMTEEVLQNLGVTDYLMCNFERPPTGDVVGVYLGYHASQIRREGGGSNENMIHPPAHCLPGSGWDIINSRHLALDLPGLPGAPSDVRRLVIAKGDSRALVYYWYQERGRVIADDWRKIIDLFWDRATRGRTDGALIRLTVPLQRSSEDGAENALRALAGEIVPRLPTYVPN